VFEQSILIELLLIFGVGLEAELLIFVEMVIDFLLSGLGHIEQALHPCDDFLEFIKLRMHVAGRFNEAKDMCHLSLQLGLCDLPGERVEFGDALEELLSVKLRQECQSLLEGYVWPDEKTKFL
jgi:hypothetical protein